MKSEAIRCAIKLYSEPTLLARFSDPFRKLPRGITELLRIVSSDTALKNISLKNNLHAPHLKMVLINYIQLILLQDDNSSRRKLGLDNSSDTSQAKLHYKLLMNIFHPDKSSTYTDPKFSQIIIHAYKDLRHNTENIKKPHPLFKVSPSFNSPYDYSDKKTNLLTAQQKITLGKISLIKNGAIAIVIMTFGVILLIPSSPQLVSKKDSTSLAKKGYMEKSLGWKSPRARNIQKVVTKSKVFIR